MDNAYFMGQALAQAEQALAHNEFPVGCVIVARDRIIATGARTGSSGPAPNEIDHAEMVALRQLSLHSEAFAPANAPHFLHTGAVPYVFRGDPFKQDL